MPRGEACPQILNYGVGEPLAQGIDGFDGPRQLWNPGLAGANLKKLGAEHRRLVKRLLGVFDRLSSHLVAGTDEVSVFSSMVIAPSSQYPGDFEPQLVHLLFQ